MDSKEEEEKVLSKTKKCLRCLKEFTFKYCELNGHAGTNICKPCKAYNDKKSQQVEHMDIF